MQYKGEDLDLRVPAHARPSRESYADFDATLSNGRWSSGGYGRDPLWVDETVLACCNYAFDIAQANGSAEVGLEHLVNALTRVEGAARVLEARGVREAQLRRESATMIANEPVSGFERVTPRRSPDFEDVLRRATENAVRRGSPATVDDVLWVLLHSPRDQPAVQLLRRMTPDWQRLEWNWAARTREYAAAQPELFRSSALYAEPRQMTVTPVIAPQPVAYPVPFDAVTSRMAIIEESLRALHAELASERKALADLIRDTQRDVVAHRGDAASLRSDLSQRLEVLERSLQARPDGSRLTVQLGDRIQMLEKSVQNGLTEGARNWAALGQRLQAIEAAMTTPDHEAGANKALFERIDTLETYLAAGGGDTSVGQAVLDRVSALEQMIEGRLSQSQRVWSGFTERLQSVERLVEASTGEGGRNWTAISERLGAFETQLRAKAPAGLEADEFLERFSGLERAVRSGFGETVRTQTAIAERVEALEKLATSGMPDLPGTEPLMLLDDRLQSIERMVQDQIAKPPAGEFDQRLAAMEQRASARNEQLMAVVRDMPGRMMAMEKQTSGPNTQAREREVAELHEAIVRLSENQHTLASAISDWRHESQNDFGSLNAQIERLRELPPVASAGQAISLPSGSMPAIARTSVTAAASSTTGQAKLDVSGGAGVEPSQRGLGFWQWLFGTDSIARSNREAELRWQHMHARIKEARDRRRSERA